VGKRGKKFVSMIRVNGETRYLGIYETPEQAHAVYAAEAVRVFGEFAMAASAPVAANDNEQVRRAA
jgi:hypothetical protein